MWRYGGATRSVARALGAPPWLHSPRPSLRLSAAAAAQRPRVASGRALATLAPNARRPRRPGAAPDGRAAPWRAMASDSLPAHEVIGLPKLSPTMEQGNLVEWKVKEGQSFSAGDVLAEVETDKATMDFEAQDDGVIAKYLVSEGTQDIAVGAPICVSVDDEKSVAAFKDFTVDDGDGASASAGGDDRSADSSQPSAAGDDTSARADEPREEEAPSGSDDSATQSSAAGDGEAKKEGAAASQPPPRARGGGDDSRVRATFYARVKAADAGVSLRDIHGSGLYGSVTAADVEDAIASGSAASAAAAGGAESPAAQRSAQPKTMDAPKVTRGDDYNEVEVSPIRRAAAQLAEQSKREVPHYYLSAVCNISRLLAVLEQWNRDVGGGGGGGGGDNDAAEDRRVSLANVLIKASALTMNKVPEVNATFLGDTVRRYRDVNVGVEVYTPQGTLQPVLRDVARSGLRGITAQRAALRRKAQANELSDGELAGSTFTVVDLSMSAVKTVTPLVTPKQAACLGIGGVTRRFVVADDVATDVDEALKAVHEVTVTLSCDHRVVDGALGAEWLQAFKRSVEDPLSMLL